MSLAYAWEVVHVSSNDFRAHRGPLFYSFSTFLFSLVHSCAPWGFSVLQWCNIKSASRGHNICAEQKKNKATGLHKQGKWECRNTLNEYLHVRFRLQGSEKGLRRGFLGSCPPIRKLLSTVDLAQFEHLFRTASINSGGDGRQRKKCPGKFYWMYSLPYASYGGKALSRAYIFRKHKCCLSKVLLEMAHKI